MEGVGEENAQELDNTGKEQIGFWSGGVGGFAMGHTKYRLEGTDGTLHGNPLAIEPAPEVRIAEDTWVKAFVGVWIDVDTPAIVGRGARLVTAAASGHAIGGFDALSLWADEFEVHRTVFAPANTVKGQRGAVAGTKRDTVLVQLGGAGTGHAPRVDGDHGPLESASPSSAPYSS